MHNDGYLTVFNRKTDLKTDNVLWFKTIVPCHWEDSTGKISSGTTDRKRNASAWVWLMSTDKKSVYPWEFEAAPNPCDLLTFADEDIIYHYCVNDDIPENGQKEFMRTHPGAYLVKSADLLRFGTPSMHHWEITCGDGG